MPYIVNSNDKFSHGTEPNVTDVTFSVDNHMLFNTDAIVYISPVLASIMQIKQREKETNLGNKGVIALKRSENR